MGHSEILPLAFNSKVVAIPNPKPRNAAVYRHLGFPNLESTDRQDALENWTFHFLKGMKCVFGEFPAHSIHWRTVGPLSCSASRGPEPLLADCARDWSPFNQQSSSESAELGKLHGLQSPHLVIGVDLSAEEEDASVLCQQESLA